MASAAGAEVERGEPHANEGGIANGQEKKEEKKEEHKDQTLESILRSRGLSGLESWWFTVLAAMLLRRPLRALTTWRVEPWLLGGPAGRQILEIAARELKVPIVRSNVSHATHEFYEPDAPAVCEWDPLADLDYTYWTQALLGEDVLVHRPFGEAVSATFVAGTFMHLPDGKVPNAFAAHAGVAQQHVVPFAFSDEALSPEEAAAVAATIRADMKSAIGGLVNASACSGSIWRLLPRSIVERRRGLFGPLQVELDGLVDKVAAMDTGA